MNRPSILISLDKQEAHFEPGEVLVGQYQIKLPPDKTAVAVESSVLWTTTGKGEEDFGVHFFERRPKQTLSASALREPHRLSTVLPRSPLSYDGVIIQVHWSVRLRVFMDGQQFTEDCAFTLGQTSIEEYSTLENPKSEP